MRSLNIPIVADLPGIGQNLQDHPLVHVAYQATQEIEIAPACKIIEGIKIARQLACSAIFDQFQGEEITPGSNAIKDDAIQAHILKSCNIDHHYGGTCKMGSDPLAVVDPELRVYGIKGLRVADASIMSENTLGNTNAPTIMIGEKAADLIKAAGCVSH